MGFTTLPCMPPNKTVHRLNLYPLRHCGDACLPATNQCAVSVSHAQAQHSNDNSGSATELGLEQIG